MRARASQSGFSLVETLIAAAIVAAMATTLSVVIARDAQARRQIAERRIAIAIAQSQLEQASAGSAASGLPSSGTEEGFQWRVARAGFGTNARDGGPPLERVSVYVTRPGNATPLVRLETLRFAR